METKNHTNRTSFLATAFVLAFLATGFAWVLVPQVAVAQSTAGVSIVNYTFRPSPITVVIGVNNTVMWSNVDYTTHTVTADDMSYYSGNIPSGGSYTHTYTTAGTYTYHCSIHTYMKGTVIVKNAVSTSSSTTTTTSSSSSTSTHSTSSSSHSSSSSTTSSSTSSSSSSKSSSSAASTSSPTPSASSATTSAAYGSAGGIPEFPFQALTVIAVTVLVLTSYIFARRAMGPRNEVV